MPGRTTRDDETLNASERLHSKLSLRIVLGDRMVTHDLPEKGDVVLGRGHDVDVFVDHRSVSRCHARLRIEPSSLTVVDLGSANGTRISGKSLTPETPVSIQAGDAIELGDVVVLIQRGHVGAAPARPSDAVVLGQSPKMAEIEHVIERIAPGMIAVLIVGETGAGKEVVAEAIHRRSRRSSKPFIRLNCAAVAEHLLESEWFGYERGAFTGAQNAKPGLLETAEGGTVLLDEVGELPLNMQAKLLRVLEEKAMLRVGAVRTRRIDVRFLAATNRDLEAEVSRGTFRQDLFFRLNGVTVHVPPLRDRREEIEPLARTFIAAASRQAERPKVPTLAPAALAWLVAYAWPGNVRELRNIMERAVLLASTDEITTDDLPPRMKPGARVGSDETPSSQGASHEEGGPRSGRGSLREAVADVEKQRVLDALVESNGNQKRAAELLGISRGTLLSRIDTFGIPRPRKG